MAGAKPGGPSSWAFSEQTADATDTRVYGYFRRLLQGSNNLVPCPAHADCSLLVAETLLL